MKKSRLALSRIRFVSLIAIATVAISCAGDKHALPVPLDLTCTLDDADCVDWRFVTDDQGRALVLRGLNTDGNAKGDSGLPSITREEVLQLSTEYGFNFTRYLIFWSQIEPNEGEYNETYLDEVETRLDWFAEAGMKVALDMHQDCWSEAVIGGHGSNGAPAWATLTDGEPNTQPPGFWSLCYVSKDIIRAFDNFWDYSKHPNLQDRYAAMWAYVADRFKDHPAVLGYDIMNEPYEGSNVDKELFDSTLFFDFNQRVIDAIRSVDSAGWVFYEPRAFGPNQAYPSYIPRLNDPREGDPRIAYFPHFYPSAYESGYVPGDDSYIERWQGNRIDEMSLQRSPMIVGEWSVLPFDDEAEMLIYMDRMNTMLDATTSGWTFWDRGVTNHRETEEGPRVLDLLIRPYPRATAGQLKSYSFDRETAVFEMKFDSRRKAVGPTEISLPTAIYPNGYQLEVSGPEKNHSAEFDEINFVLSIETNNSQDQYRITVRPAE